MLRRMLIIDEVAPRRTRLQARLQAACYEVQSACGLAGGLSLLRGPPADLLLLSGGLLAGPSACDLLRRRTGQPGLPILALLGQAEGETRVRALLAGACEVLPDDATGPLLLAQIRSLLRQSYGPRAPYDEMPDAFCEAPAGLERPSLIAVVGPEALTKPWCRSLRAFLEPHRLMPLSPQTLLAREDLTPDALLVCGGPGDGAAPGLLADLLARRGPAGAPLIWISPSEAAEQAATALDLGADAVLPASATPLEAATRLRRLIGRRLRNEARMRLLHDGLRLALTDPLTGLSNRRHALPALSRMLRETGPGGTDCAVMLLDLDHFKQVNDTFGHAAGDDVLTEVARRLRSTLEPDDLIARYGGEEFLIAAKLGAGRDPIALADHLRSTLALRPIPLPAERRSLPVTASIGLALSRGAACPADEMLRRADEALLSAKRQGRNQVCLAHQLAA